jgi:hypothetical protein
LATLQRGKVENFKNPAIFLLFSEKKKKKTQNRKFGLIYTEKKKIQKFLNFFFKK